MQGSGEPLTLLACQGCASSQLCGRLPNVQVLGVGSACPCVRMCCLHSFLCVLMWALLPPGSICQGH